MWATQLDETNGWLVAAGYNRRNLQPERGKQFDFEPRIALQPQVIARARVWQGKSMGPRFPPREGEFRHRSSVRWEVIGLSVLTND